MDYLSILIKFKIKPFYFLTIYRLFYQCCLYLKDHIRAYDWVKNLLN